MLQGYGLVGVVGDRGQLNCTIFCRNRRLQQSCLIRKVLNVKTLISRDAALSSPDFEDSRAMPEDSRATLWLLARVSSTLTPVVSIIGEHHRHLQSISVNSTKFEFDRAICRKLSQRLRSDSSSSLGTHSVPLAFNSSVTLSMSTPNAAATYLGKSVLSQPPAISRTSLSPISPAA